MRASKKRSRNADDTAKGQVEKKHSNPQLSPQSLQVIGGLIASYAGVDPTSISLCASGSRSLNALCITVPNKDTEEKLKLALKVLCDEVLLENGCEFKENEHESKENEHGEKEQKQLVFVPTSTFIDDLMTDLKITDD